MSEYKVCTFQNGLPMNFFYKTIFYVIFIDFWWMDPQNGFSRKQFFVLQKPFSTLY